MGLGKQGNQVYVTDLGLATERRAAQLKANSGSAPRLNLVGTARFASVNGHLGVGKCNVLKSCWSKTDGHTSAKSLR